MGWIVALILVSSANALLFWSLCRVSGRMSRWEEQSAREEALMRGCPQVVPEVTPLRRASTGTVIREPARHPVVTIHPRHLDA